MVARHVSTLRNAESDGLIVEAPGNMPEADQEWIVTEAPRWSDEAQREDAPDRIDIARRGNRMSSDVETMEGLREQVRRLQQECGMLRTLVSDFLMSLALGPDLTKWYAEMFRQLIRKALSGVEAIQNIEYTECSFPSVPSEAPQCELVVWRGLEYSEWDVDWSPNSWWVAVSVSGRQGTFLPSFSVVATVSEFHVTGKRLRVALARDCGSVRLSFCEMPVIALSVGTRAVLGSIPLPLQDRIERAISREVDSSRRTWWAKTTC